MTEADLKKRRASQSRGVTKKIHHNTKFKNQRKIKLLIEGSLMYRVRKGKYFLSSRLG